MAIVHCDSNLCAHWVDYKCVKKEIILEHNEDDDLKCISFLWSPNYFLKENERWIIND